MNKKSIRSRTTKPIQKSLPAAVHAAAMSLDGETAGAASEPLIVDAAAHHGHDTPADGLADSGFDDTAAPADAGAAEAPAAPVKSAHAKKPEKPGKPVKLNLTLPANEAKQFDALRHALQAGGAKVKKSTLLRAALLGLADIEQERLAQIVSDLQPPKAVKAPLPKPKSKK